MNRGILRGAMSQENEGTLSRGGMHTRVATVADLGGVTATLTAAFQADPLWSWAFPNSKDLAAWWHF